MPIFVGEQIGVFDDGLRFRAEAFPSSSFTLKALTCFRILVPCAVDAFRLRRPKHQWVSGLGSRYPPSVIKRYDHPLARDRAAFRTPPVLAALAFTHL